MSTFPSKTILYSGVVGELVPMLTVCSEGHSGARAALVSDVTIPKMTLAPKKRRRRRSGSGGGGEGEEEDDEAGAEDGRKSGVRHTQAGC